MNRTFRRGVSVAIVSGGALLMGAISHGARERGTIHGFTSSRTAEEEILEQKFRSIPDPGHVEADLRHLTSEPLPWPAWLERALEHWRAPAVGRSRCHWTRPNSRARAQRAPR